MTVPNFSSPIIFSSTDLATKPTLIEDIIELINDGFARSQKADPVKWGETPGKRFLGSKFYLDMLGKEGFAAVIYDDGVEAKVPNEDNSISESLDTVSPMLLQHEGKDPELRFPMKKFAAGQMTGEQLELSQGHASANTTIFNKQDPEKNRKLVAVAAALPWYGGNLEGIRIEEGWELKAVAVDGDTKYLHRGLATQLCDALTQRLIEKETIRLAGMTGQQTPSIGNVTLWIQAAECINGEYWRRKGYQEIQRRTFGEGIWDCLTSFEMVILRKDVTFAVNMGEGRASS